MLNIYMIYISTLETGDVDILPTVYTSFSQASNSIDGIINNYMTNIKVNSYKILHKGVFDIKLLNKDEMLPGTYYFKKKTSGCWIYKKVLVEGRFWNGSKLVKVGKIGISSEINIPFDTKMVRLLETVSPFRRSPEAILPENIKINGTKDQQVIVDPNSIDEYKLVSAKQPSNYEHGQHVSFIQELKNRLANRRQSIIGDIEIPKNPIDTEDFGAALANIKGQLTRITPPPSPDYGLGRVIDPISVIDTTIIDPIIIHREPLSAEDYIEQMLIDIYKQDNIDNNNEPCIKVYNPYTNSWNRYDDMSNDETDTDSDTIELSDFSFSVNESNETSDLPKDNVPFSDGYYFTPSGEIIINEEKNKYLAF